MGLDFSRITAMSIPQGSATKIEVSGVKLWQAVTYPEKSDIITMNLDGTDRQYRVLKKVQGSTFEVLGLFSPNTSITFRDNETNTYSGSNVDTYLNTTWYNTLSSTAKTAIVDKTITQYEYTDTRSEYNADTHASYAGYSTKTSKGSMVRHIYALDCEDVEMYFGGTGGSASATTKGTFSKADVLTAFYNQSTPSYTYALRSSRYVSRAGVQRYDIGWIINTNGDIDSTNVDNNRAVFPAFQIDLSKVTYE